MDVRVPRRGVLLSFVLLGVGSGSTGISDILQNFFTGSSATGSSLSALQKKTADHPKDAAAWLELANKLQADNQHDDAAAALTTYTTLRPKDQTRFTAARGDLPPAGDRLEDPLHGSQARSQAIRRACSSRPAPLPLGQAIGTVTTAAHERRRDAGRDGHEQRVQAGAQLPG